MWNWGSLSGSEQKPALRDVSDLDGIEVSADNGVTPARRVLEALTIQDVHMPVRVANQPLRLQRAGDEADGRPLHTQHHRQEFVTQTKLLEAHAIVGHQQPSRAPFVDGMQCVARRRLHHLRDD